MPANDGASTTIDEITWREPDRHDDEGPGEVEQRFRSLMEGLRTTLPGVQVLVAFLLILPFQGPFADLSRWQDGLFMIAFGSGMAASMLLIAPSVHQRVRAPQTGVERRSERHLRIAVRTTILGTVLMAVSFVASTALVTSVVAGSDTAIVAGVGFAALAGWFWFAQPMTWRDDER